ncbi:hypothetical protein HZC07_01540 [Candidatus Micrarchaeota archaeon]|nr:hypothetical protein [Candidatus Micrarchaeota archaeon]
MTEKHNGHSGPVTAVSHRPVQSLSTRMDRRRFFTALGIMGGSLLLPKTARAVEETMDVAGHKVAVLRLDDTLADLNGRTEKYREEMRKKGHSIENILDDRTYVHSLIVKGHVTFMAILKPNGKKVLSAVNGNIGAIGFALDGYLTVLKDLGMQDPARVDLVVDQGTVNGVLVTNCYLMARDARGRLLGKLNRGNYLAYAISISGSELPTGGVYVMIEPQNKDTYALLAPK